MQNNFRKIKPARISTRHDNGQHQGAEKAAEVLSVLQKEIAVRVWSRRTASESQYFD
jgi:hypothetical protein